MRAPISGRISDRRVDPGNLVAAGEGAAATLLTTINAVDPIYFTFDGSEGLFLQARRNGLSKGADVEIKLQDETAYSHHGTLDFTDNGLDPQSGTIRAARWCATRTISSPRHVRQHAPGQRSAT